MTPQELHQAYTETNFKVFASDTKTIVVNIDKESTELEKEYPELTTWAFITAWNPSPKILEEQENNKRNEDLIEEVKKLNLYYTPGVGSSADEKWSEVSILIHNISFENANNLSKKFGQLAFVFGYKNQKANLVYTK